MLRYRREYDECPMHKMVSEKTKELLAEYGEFSFERVLGECKLKPSAEFINWGFVRDEMEELDYSLIPVASAFFSKERFKEFVTESGERVKKIDRKPLKFLTVGNGKSTEGYVTEAAAPESIRFAYIQVNANRAAGYTASVSEKETRMREAGLLPFAMLPYKDEDDENQLAA